MTNRTAIFLTIIPLLAACGQSNDTPPPKLFEDQRAALDKVKAASAAQQEQAEKQRKAIEQQTQ